jgi:hypothetical protein
VCLHFRVVRLRDQDFHSNALYHEPDNSTPHNWYLSISSSDPCKLRKFSQIRSQPQPSSSDTPRAVKIQTGRSNVKKLHSIPRHSVFLLKHTDTADQGRLLMRPKSRQCSHKPLNPVLWQLNPIHTFNTLVPHILLILPYHLCLGLPSALFPLNTFHLLHACCTPHSTCQFLLTMKKEAISVTGHEGP